MKRNFLLLLLLTLLPLAGWAASADFVDGKKPSLQARTYTGNPQILLSDGWEWNNSLPEDYDTANGGVLFLVTASNEIPASNEGSSSEYPTKTSVGKYYVWYKVLKDNDEYQDDSNWKQVGTSAVRINQATLDFKAPVGAQNLAYNGEAQKLITTAGSADLEEAVVKYSLDNGESWITDSEEIVGLAAKTYDIQYMVDGNDNFKGVNVATLSVTISKATLEFSAPEGANDLVYNGEDQKLIADAGFTNLGNLEYSLDGNDWKTNFEEIVAKNADNYDVYYRVEGDDENYDGVDGHFSVTIAAATFPEVELDATEFTYNMGAQKPEVTIEGLTEGNGDYTIAWPDDVTNAGEKTITITPSDNYGGEEAKVEKTYTIKKKNIETSEDIEGKTSSAAKGTGNLNASKRYNGKEQKLTINTAVWVEHGGTKIDKKYFDVTWENNVNAGNYQDENPPYAVFTGKDNYEGTLKIPFTILQRDFNNEDVIPYITATFNGGEAVTYNTEAQEPAVVINDALSTINKALTAETDYTVTGYTDNTNAGTGHVTIEGKGNYTGTKTFDFIIAQASVTVTAKDVTMGYGTSFVDEGVTIDGLLGQDELTGKVTYTIKDKDTEDVVLAPYAAGTYDIVPGGLTNGNYDITFAKGKLTVTEGQVTASVSGTATYGSLPEFTLTATAGLSPAEAANFNATNNLKTVTVKRGDEVVANGVKDDETLKALPVGKYVLEATAILESYNVVVNAGELTVNPNNAAAFVISEIDDVDYKGSKWEPEVTVTLDGNTLTVDKDYTITYGDETHDNTNAGEAIVKIAGIGNFAGASANQTFTINKVDLTIAADRTTWTYGEDEPKYEVTVTGLQGEDKLAVGGTLAGIDGTLQVKRTSNETKGLHKGALVPYFADANYIEIASPVATNYNLTLTEGDLTVTAGAASIRLKSAVTATYGDDPDDAINAAIKEIANYEAVKGLTDAELNNVNLTAVKYDDLADAEYQVGTDYTFTISGATSTNYTITIENGTYKVNPAAITLYAEDQAIDWKNDKNADADTEVKDKTVIIAKGELKYEDALTDVVKSVNVESKNVGSNNITLTAADNPNYSITVNKDKSGEIKYGVLTITGVDNLILNSKEDMLATINSYNGQTLNVSIDFTSRNGRNLNGERNWGQYDWMTLVLPFDISVADLSKALGYAIVNVIDPTRTVISEDKSQFFSKLTMTGGNGDEKVLKANKPFLVKTADDITGTINLGTQTIVAPVTPEVDLSVDAGGVQFVGTYSTRTVNSQDNEAIWFRIGGGYQAWAYILNTSSSEWDILPFEAYIDMNAVPANARNIIFYVEEIDGSTTALKSITADENGGKLNADGIYNLNGVKMDGAPTQKGIYIQNGKKVVVK